MAFEDPNVFVDRAVYNLSTRFKPADESGYGISFSLSSAIGDGTPAEAQETAFQALIDLFEQSPDFDVEIAYRTYSAQQTITTTPAEAEPGE